MSNPSILSAMNKKQEELLKKEFKVNEHFSISRGDYEGMPCAMLAWNWSDEKMQELANRTKQAMGDLDIYDLDNKFDKEEMEDNFWINMETEAVHMGMEYYEDMTDERLAELKKEFDKIK